MGTIFPRILRTKFTQSSRIWLFTCTVMRITQLPDLCCNLSWWKRKDSLSCLMPQFPEPPWAGHTNLTSHKKSTFPENKQTLQNNTHFQWTVVLIKHSATNYDLNMFLSAQGAVDSGQVMFLQWNPLHLQRMYTKSCFTQSVRNKQQKVISLLRNPALLFQ